MPSKESLAKTKSLCSCTGFPEGEHGPRCPAGKAADLLDEAIREKEIRTLTEAERMFGLPGEFKNWVQARLAQLREGKT